MYSFLKTGVTEEVTQKVELGTAKATIQALQNSSYTENQRLESKIVTLQSEIRAISDKMIRMEKGL